MTVNFFIPHLMPGSPADALRQRLSTGGHFVTTAQLQTILAEFGFDPKQNLLGQYLTYLRDMVTLHWGVSIGGSLGTPVTTLIMQALPWTLGLVGVTTIAGVPYLARSLAFSPAGNGEACSTASSRPSSWSCLRCRTSSWRNFAFFSSR